MANEEQREQFKRYKQDVERRGKPFYPYAMFHDTVMSLVVVCVITILAVVWYYSAGEEPGDAGLLGPRLGEEADPGTTSYTPRPDWYFYFLFYLLRIFKWPESVILGTVGIPTILMILLFAVPFLDRRRERRLIRRPVAVVASLLVIASMGILTYRGATAEEPSAVGAEALLTANNIETDDEKVVMGAELMGGVGCLNCHTYAGQGAAGPGPELTSVGEGGEDVAYWMDWIRDPSALGGEGMPGFPTLTDEQLEALGLFLEASKGGG